jgi:N-acetylmuramoyl-L-alanine amidase
VPSPFIFLDFSERNPPKSLQSDLPPKMTRRRNQIIKAATTLALGVITCLPTRSQTAPPAQPEPKPQTQQPAPPSAQPQTQPQTPQQTQPPTQPQPQPKPRTLILIDPAHGGPDAGDHLDEHLLEKDYTLALAMRLRPLLNTNGFAVIATRDADPTTLFTTDLRAGIINHSHPSACLLLHATSYGTGIHIVTSALPPPLADEPQRIIPWDTAQANFLPQSVRLANELGMALLRAKVPVLLIQASVRPLDNLTCPAVAVEVAPLAITGSEPVPVADQAYQQRVADAIAAALTSWRTHNTPPAPGATR